MERVVIGRNNRRNNSPLVESLSATMTATMSTTMHRLEGRSRWIQRPFWQLNLAFWVLFGTGAFGVRLLLHEDIFQALVFTAIMEFTSIVLCYGLRFLYRNTASEFGLQATFILILASLGAAMGQTLVGTGFTVLTGWHNSLMDFFVTISLRVTIMWFVFLNWSLGYFWWRSEVGRTRQARLRAAAQREAHRLELQMLRAQLDPHFLFNSLNGIAAEIEPHPEAATAMVEELAGYLRYSLAHRKQAIGVLSSELEAMAAYLEIERARFGERLHPVVRATDSARQCRVPSFLLQPLVENAVKHGLENALECVDLEICAITEGDVLIITVSNTGNLTSSSGHEESLGERVGGLGLENLRRRLELHYPGRAEFTLQENNGRVLATLHLHGPPCSA